MPIDSSRPRRLPERPSLRHLKDQAKDLVKAGGARSLTDAQFRIARSYGFASWPKLKTYVESFDEIGRLKQAIDANDLERVRTLMSRRPSLHEAPLGDANAGPLTWVAECRVPHAPPGPPRLAIARWMIENGSNVHQGGNRPLMRAALDGDRIPMMELLVAHGADVNGDCGGHFPIIYAPCETVDPAALAWLLSHGADPNRGAPAAAGTALDYLIGTYVRSPELARCIELLLDAGAETRYDAPGVLEILCDRIEALGETISEDPQLVDRRLGDLDFGCTGGRRLSLRGATLLHVAAEFGNLRAARLLLARGADVNARAEIDATGIGGQTAVFHAATQFSDRGLPMTRLLAEHGADLSVSAKVPGHYEQPDEVIECTVLGYAQHFPGTEGKTVVLLRDLAAAQ